MRVALLFDKAKYDNASVNMLDILAIEIIDPTITDVSETDIFEDPNTEKMYIKIIHDLDYLTQ